MALNELNTVLGCSGGYTENKEKRFILSKSSLAPRAGLGLHRTLAKHLACEFMGLETDPSFPCSSSAINVSSVPYPNLRANMFKNFE